MNYNKHCRIGMRVIISPQHWLRPNEVGLVVNRQRDARGKVLVQFEESFPGGGINGDRLWLDQYDVSEVVPESDSRDAIAPESRDDALSECAALS